MPSDLEFVQKRRLCEIPFFPMPGSFRPSLEFLATQQDDMSVYSIVESKIAKGFILQGERFVHQVNDRAWDTIENIIRMDFDLMILDEPVMLQMTNVNKFLKMISYFKRFSF